MNLNDRLLRLVIKKLTEARAKPPTVFRLLLIWPGMPMLLLVGVVAVTILVALDLPSFGPIFMADMIVGAALRDVGIARKTVRVWSIHQELYDWQKIDSLAKQLNDVQDKS